MINRRELLKRLSAAGVAGALPMGAALPSALPRIRQLPATAGDLQARLDAAIAKHKVPGASVALFSNGAMETAAAGVVNAATGVEMTTDTVMHIGSITKTLNTTLVMQLVDAGLVSLDRPLKSYLPDFRVADRDATERITVGMLLNHTSGINGELTAEAGHDNERIEDGVARITTMDQLHAPGADMSYCNAGMVLAGYLAQRLTGRGWYDLVKERIYTQLEMTHSIAVPEDAVLHRASVGHYRDPATGKISRTTFAFLPLSLAPAGATAMMSATDLVTFTRAHLNDGVAPNGYRLLSSASTRAMQTKSATYQGIGFADLGLGWMLSPNGIVTHGGGGPGILSWLYAHPASNTVIAVLTNGAFGTGLINDLVQPVLAPLGASPFGSDAVALASQATDAPVDPARYVGMFESVATAVRIVLQGNGIALTSRGKVKSYETTNMTETPPYALRPIRDGHFALGGSVLSFVNPDSSGRAGHIAISGRLLKRTE